MKNLNNDLLDRAQELKYFFYEGESEVFAAEKYNRLIRKIFNNDDIKVVERFINILEAVEYKRISRTGCSSWLNYHMMIN